MKGMKSVIIAGIAMLVFAGVMAVAISQTERPAETAGTQIAQAPGAGGGAARRMDQYREAMRQRLTAAGATEEEAQAISAFVQARFRAHMPLRQQLQSLREAAGAEATEAQAKEAVSKYEAAMKTALDTVAKGEADLRAKLKLADRAKLHAALLSMGVLDNGMGGMGMGFMGRGGRPGPPGPGGRGGPGPRGAAP